MSFARPTTQPQPSSTSQANSPVPGHPPSGSQPIMGIGLHGTPLSQQSGLLGQQAPGQQGTGTPQVTPRLLELFEQIKNEFANVNADMSRQMSRKDEADSKLIHQHMNELNQVRKTIYELNQAHRQMRDRYEAEISKLKQRLDSVQPQPPFISRIQKSDEHQAQPTLQPLPLPQEEQKNGKLLQENHEISSLEQSSHAGAHPQPGASRSGAVQLPGTAQLSGAVQPGLGAIQPSDTSPPGQFRMQNANNLEFGTFDTVSFTSGSTSTAPLGTSVPTSGTDGALNGPAVTANAPVGASNDAVFANGSAPATAGATQQLDQESGGDIDSREDSSSKDNFLINLDISKVPEKFKKETNEYKALYNPELPRNLDVELLHSLTHNSVVCCVRFSNDGRYLATGCNRSAQIFDVETGELLNRLQDPNVDDTLDLYIRSVCFSPDGKYLATGAEDHKVRVWQIETKEIKHVFDGHDQDIYSLVFTASGRYVVSGSGDRNVKMWDIETGKCFREFLIEDGVTAVAVSPDDRYIAAGSLDKSVRVWDIEANSLVERLEGPSGHEDSVYSVSYRPGGLQLVSGSLDKTLKVWELKENVPHQGKVKTTVHGHNDYVLSVAVTADSRWILSGSKDRTVQMWSAETGEAQLMLQAHVNSVISVAPAPVGSLFASGGGDFTAKIWKYSEKA